MKEATGMNHKPTNKFLEKVQSFVEKGNINLNISVNDGVIRMNGNKTLIEFVSKNDNKMSLK